LCKKIMGAELGAKLKSNEVFFEFGGGASNTAVNFSQLGLKTAVLSTLGDDFDGRAIAEYFRQHHISPALLQVSKQKRTGFSFLAVNKKSGEHVAHIYYGAAEDLLVKPVWFRQHKTAWYYVSSLNTEASKWRRVLTGVCTQAKSYLAWNPGSAQLASGYRLLSPFLKRTFLLILNRDEAIELILSHPQRKKAGSIQQMLKYLYGWGPKIVLITDGAKGAQVYDGRNFYAEKALVKKPKDTTGAGDCFASSFLAGFIRYQGNISAAMKLAMYNSASLVSQVGAQRGLLTWQALPSRFHLKQGR